MRPKAIQRKLSIIQNEMERMVIVYYILAS